MKRFSALFVLLFATLCLTACGDGGDPHEAAIEDMLDVMNDFEGELAGVTDADSAKALGSKMDSIAKRFDAWSITMSELDVPTEEKRKALEEKYKPQLEVLQTKMGDHMERISKLGMDVLMPVLDAMGKIEPSEKMPEWME